MYKIYQSKAVIIYRNTLIVITLCIGVYLCLYGFSYFKDTVPSNAKVYEDKELVVCGIPIGVYIETDGLLVLETGDVKGRDGLTYSPAKNILKAGDYIMSVNNKKINNKEKFIEYIQKTKEEDITLKVRRNNSYIKVAVKKIKGNDGTYKIGTWIRNNMQGIGTLTYYDATTGKYGALGHGINDVDTSKLMEIQNGNIYNAKIIDVVKGKKNNPGELVGVINYIDEYNMGKLMINSKNGIYGKMNKVGEDNLLKYINDDNLKDVYKVGTKKDIKEGKAYVRTQINDKIDNYEIRIDKINQFDTNSNKNFIIKINDKKLIRQTGGIVQGMSGSPIIQEGKIVGAVTHVMVKDPTRGYGIFIDKMLKH